jgi:hypothetical protein
VKTCLHLAAANPLCAPSCAAHGSAVWCLAHHQISVSSSDTALAVACHLQVWGCCHLADQQAQRGQVSNSPLYKQLWILALFVLFVTESGDLPVPSCQYLGCSRSCTVKPHLLELYLHAVQCPGSSMSQCCCLPPKHASHDLEAATALVALQALQVRAALPGAHQPHGRGCRVQCCLLLLPCVLTSCLAI